MSDSHHSRAEQLAHKWFTKFNEHKMLFGFSAMLILTICSIYFNFRLGRLNSSPADMTWWVMPLSYSFLDIALLCIVMALAADALRGLLMPVSWAWAAFLLVLSLFACLSCIIALDAEKSSTGDAFKRQQLERSLADANDTVDTWKRNTALTIKHKSRFQAKLDDATERRDSIVDEISRLDEATPPSQVIFEKAEAFLPPWMDADMFKTLSRLIFGFAMICTPLLLTAVLAQVFSNYSPQIDPNGGGKKRFSPGENDSFSASKWENFGNSSNKPSPVSANAHNTGTTAELTLNRSALNDVREWLKNEEGRVTRAQIKYRSGNQTYDQITLIIKQLEKEGWLARMGNGQLKVGRGLRAVS